MADILLETEQASKIVNYGSLEYYNDKLTVQNNNQYLAKNKLGDGLSLDENGVLNVNVAGTTVDTALSDTSENPVQNKVVKTALDKKANATDIPTLEAGNNITLTPDSTTNKITISSADFPTSLPANGGNADTVGGLYVNEIAGNPNLLINPDFKINQRAATVAVTSGTYTVDRWYFTLGNVANGNTGSFDANRLILTSDTKNTAGYYATLGQFIEKPERLAGKQLTISAEAESTENPWFINLWYKSSENSDTEILIPQKYSSDLIQSAVCTLPADMSSGCSLRAIIQTRGTTKLKWMKAEIGKAATPFVPPDSAVELLKCQRYYQIRSTGNIPNCDLRPNMRDGVNPTITALSDGTYSYDAEI